MWRSGGRLTHVAEPDGLLNDRLLLADSGCAGLEGQCLLPLRWSRMIQDVDPQGLSVRCGRQGNCRERPVLTITADSKGQLCRALHN